jgi:hypothetical protein
LANALVAEVEVGEIVRAEGVAVFRGEMIPTRCGGEVLPNAEAAVRDS